ncbi:MAG: leucine-rich repeat domain-containing protein [Cryomorphaceae bacterium]|nr:leucine-rich repeat domain-containing protein [Cryomorphaceae bacterium]
MGNTTAYNTNIGKVRTPLGWAGLGSGQISLVMLILLFSLEAVGQTKMRVKRKQLPALEQTMAEHTQIRFLILKRLRLDHIPVAITKFPQLDSLDLYNNRIRHISEEEAKMLVGLRYLRLGKNPMEVLPKSLLILERLEVLDLWNSDISEIPTELLKMKWLKVLDIRQTRLTRSQIEAIREALPDTEVKATWQCDCK